MFKTRRKTKRVSAAKVKPVKSMTEPPGVTANPLGKVLIAVLYSLGIILLISGRPVTWESLLGASVLVLLTHFLFTCYIIRFQQEVYQDMIQFVMVLVLALITVGFARMTIALDWWSPFLIPISFVGVIMAIVFNQRFAMEVTGVLLLYMCICLHGYDDLIKIVVTLFAGSMTGILLSGSIRRRSKLVNVGLMIGTVHVLVIASLSLFMNEANSSVAVSRDLLRGFMHGAVVGFLLTGFLPLIEFLLGTVTEISLLELSNQNEQPLLRKLLIEAPGTHHHSFVVGIFSETAAEKIGANALLCRVGAYFHDIGKLNKPEYFIENSGEAAVKHNLLNPEMSTLIITAHTKDGLEVAKYYSLPKAIEPFITEHHGTSAVEYFYREALARGDERSQRISRDTFRYAGPRPRSRETAIVMIADSAEAATRSLTDPTPGRIQGQIHDIIMDKLADGQLDECPLTIKDLRHIETAFFQVAVGIFHKRPVLPKFSKQAEAQRASNHHSPADTKAGGDSFDASPRKRQNDWNNRGQPPSEPGSRDTAGESKEAPLKDGGSAGRRLKDGD